MNVFSRSTENVVQHDFREPSGLGVLLAGMIRADYHRSVVEDTHRTVPKRWRRHRVLPLECVSGRKVRLERDTAQQHNDTNSSKLLQFIEKLRLTVQELRR